MTWLLIAVGAGLGAPARYATDRAIQSRHRSALPLGTLTVNVIASFLVGVLAGAALDGRWASLIGTGFCGALSTYSTFGYETMRLAQVGRTTTAGLNVLVSLVAGIGMAALGWWLGTLR